MRSKKSSSNCRKRRGRRGCNYVEGSEVYEEIVQLKTTQKILDLIRENPHIARKELAGLVGLSEAGIGHWEV